MSRCVGEEPRREPTKLLDRARRLGDKLPDWIKKDPETAEFVEYWFAPPQAEDLSRIARVLIKAPPSGRPASRRAQPHDRDEGDGASLARDTSHSRPHRVADDNDYDVFDEFVKSAKKLEALIDGPRLSIARASGAPTRGA